MGKPTSYWSLVSFFILSSFLFAKIHGISNKQAGALDKLHKSKSKFDMGHFKAQEIEIKKVYDSQEGLKEKDKIESLPGQPKVEFSQYGGYVTVDEIAGRAFYYYFVEAQRSKETLPLLLWLNGGPGCSSLAYGAMQELGPFRVNSDGKTLYKNIYPWNYAANVLFLESPAGVGFSYSNRSSDYTINGDKKTASDNYVFLVNWLERFPEYKNRDFYISGESYAGHYVPELAHTILYHNKKANKTIINLKGILIGNAAINDETDNKGIYDFLASHAIISDKAANVINTFCNISEEFSKQSKECQAAANEIDKATAHIEDIYNIYAPTCHNNNLTAYPKRHSFVIDPCSDAYVHAYLNREDVQKALHANVTKLSYDWEPCNDLSPWGDSPSTILPILHELLDNGLRVWIFSCRRRPSQLPPQISA